MNNEIDNSGCIVYSQKEIAHSGVRIEQKLFSWIILFGDRECF